MAKFCCRLRKLRKSACLSQRELVRLLGLKSQGVFSAIEAGRKRPGLAVALAAAIIFELPARDIFPDLAHESAEAVLAAARDLRAKGVDIADDFLAALVERLESSHTTL